MFELLAARYVYLFVVALLSIGLFALITERHLVKKLVGLVLFQTAVFLFFIEGSVREDGDVPVIDPAIGSNPDAYVNPLPHLLILTALVVGVAVIGVALALIVTIHRSYGTLDDLELSGLDEDELAARSRRSETEHRADTTAEDMRAADRTER